MATDRGRVYAGQSEQERRTERRERLLAAGLGLFASGGWESASIERLCADASVSTRYFYEEFTGREDLLEAVFVSVIDAAVQRLVSPLDGPGDPHDLVESGLRDYVSYLTEEPARMRVLYQDARKLSSVATIRDRRAETYLSALARVAERAGQRAAHQSLLRVRALSGALNEVLVHWLSCPEPRPDVERFVDDLCRCLPEGLLGLRRAP